MPKLLYKDNVKPYSLRIVCVAINIANEYNFPNDIVITSGNDSTHKEKSLHYSNNAVDFRIKNFPSNAAKEEFAKLMKNRLGPDYDVIFESKGTENEHLHVEYDPDGIH